MIRLDPSRISRIVRLVQSVMTAVGATLGQGLLGQLGIKPEQR